MMSGARNLIAVVLALALVEETLSQYQDHYKVLGVEATCSKKDIKKAYIQLSLKWHPDKNAGKNKEKATKEMQKINSAYEILHNTERRAEYDQEREHGYSFESFSDFNWDFDYRSTIRKRASDILNEANIEGKYEYSFASETAKGSWLIFIYDDDAEDHVNAAKAFAAATKVAQCRPRTTMLGVNVVAR